MAGVPRVVLGRRGPRVPAVGLGLWQAGFKMWGPREEEAVRSVREAIRAALEHGLTLFDTAEIYGQGFSEKLLGEEVGNRDDAFIVSKVAGYRVTRRGVLKAAEGIRRRLKRDAVDLLLHHWPPPLHTPLCSVVRALEEAVDRGLARYIGLSNYPENLLGKAVECARRHEILVDQVQYSLAYRVVERGLRPLAEKLGVTIMAWSPLAKGALAGKTAADNKARKGDPVFNAASKDAELLETLRSIAEGLGATMAQVALAWLVAKGSVPVVGFRRRRHVEEAFKAARLRLPEWAIHELDKASEKYRSLWGAKYSAVQNLRWVPSPIQMLVIRLMGGI